MSKPVAKIGKVEDSPDWLDRRLVEAYLRTTYRAVSPFFEIKIGVKNAAFEKWLEERGFKTYAFITAWNPRSKMLSEAENRLKNKDLEADLKKVTRLVAPALNVPAASDWPPEESFLALGISPEDVIELGKKFTQNAVVWWEKGGVPELWWLV
jgi:hypothetical protein